MCVCSVWSLEYGQTKATPLNCLSSTTDDDHAFITWRFLFNVFLPVFDILCIICSLWFQFTVGFGVNPVDSFVFCLLICLCWYSVTDLRTLVCLGVSVYVFMWFVKQKHFYRLDFASLLQRL